MSWPRPFRYCGGARLRYGGCVMTIVFLFWFVVVVTMLGRHSEEKSTTKRQAEADPMVCQGCYRSVIPGPDRDAPSTGGSETVTVEEDMRRRREYIAQACSQLPSEAILHDMSHSMVSRRHHFLYCPVEKSASTFWRRFMYQLIKTDPMRSPFEVSVQRVYSADFPSAETSIKERGEELSRLMQESTRMIFVREPYSRLLSAYVDKLISPNPILWQFWGRPAINLCTDLSKQPWCKNLGIKVKVAQGPAPPPHCAQEVTFPEFIKFVTSQLAVYNPHVMPIFRLCSPCMANYTVVGHMETVDRDIRFLLPHINITESQVNLEKMDANVAYDAIDDSVRDSMSKGWLSQSLKCISKMEVVTRIWRKLQIRGFVTWRLTPWHFGLNPKTVESLDGPKLTEILLQANSRSTDRRELKAQKKQALREAYAQLQPEQFDEIKERFGPDFKLFGFKETPKFFEEFRSDSFINTEALDLSKDWDMSKLL